MTRSLDTIFELVDRAKALTTVDENTRTPLKISDEYIMRVLAFRFLEHFDFEIICDIFLRRMNL